MSSLPRVVWLGIAAAMAVAGLAGARAGHFVLTDDVYFYLQIADAIHRGDGSTFNGLLLTNC